MRQVECSGKWWESPVFHWARQIRRYLSGAENASIRVFSLESNADVGLEVCKREYIFLRGPCAFVQFSSVVTRMPATEILLD